MNKTLGASVVVTESERRNTPLIFSIVVAVLLVVAAWFIYRATTNRSTKIHINGARFTAEIVDTPVAREKGLSDRDHLDQNRVMMFVFQDSGTQCFWMRDMKFPIDIVWLNDQKKITAIAHNVNPSTYPQTYCHDGSTVLEFAAGVAGKHNFKTGDQADL